jgi:hypothetical protein
MRTHIVMLGSVTALGLVLALGASCGGAASGNGGDGSDAGAGGGGGGGGDGDGEGSGGSGDGGDAGTTTDLPYGQCAGEEGQPPSDNALCLVENDPADPDNPGTFGVIEHAFVTYNGVEAVHVRVTLDPDFVDNTYGENICGWTGTGHSFFDLEESDRLEIVMLSSVGDVVFDLSIDYISEDPDSECGYATLGVTGDEGAVLVGDPDAILGVQTSLSQNFNERGYCYPEDSPPAGDDCCTPPEEAPDWDFRVVYDVWVARSAFEPVGFGSAYMSYVHASPSKLGPGQNTVEVTPRPCKDDGDDDDDGGGGDDGGNDCTGNDDCPDGYFCYSGDCLPIIR